MVGYNLFSHFLYAEFLSCAHIDVAVAYFFTVRSICVFKVYIQQYMYTGICHFFAP